MRKTLSCILVLTLLLAGCGAIPADPTTVPAKTDPTAGTTAPAELPQTTAAPTENTTAPTETTAPAADPTTAATEEPDPTEPAATQEPEGRLPYLQYIAHCDQSIYEGPSYDYCVVATVREKGTYTIVEEKMDDEGNLWGRLKSGIGWVDLTEIQSEEYKNALLSANFADEDFLLHGSYHHFPGADEYCSPIAFRAYGRLRDVALFTIVYADEGDLPGEDFFTLPEMTEEMPIVAELAFPGDMTSYGIRFTDEAGTVHMYFIYISGRNGSLILVKK